MEEDKKLLEKAELGEIGARVYSWDGPWVSLGRSQSPERDLLPTNSVPYVERPTGGHAVLHGHDVTIGLALPIEAVTRNLTGVRSRSVRLSYRAATQPIIDALQKCGVSASLAADTNSVRANQANADCFAAISETDIVDGKGHKICGCALRRTRGAILIQASIPNGPPLVDPATVFRDPSPNVGPQWDSSDLADHLETALRYNFFNVPA